MPLYGASREVGQRFDFKGTNAKFELKDHVITLSAPADFQLKQMIEILKLKLAKRGIDVACLKIDDLVITGQTAKQIVMLREGYRYGTGQEAPAPDEGFETEGAGGPAGQAGACHGARAATTCRMPSRW